VHKPTELSSKSLKVTEISQSNTKTVQSNLLEVESKADTPRFLITLDKGIGDTAIVGLSAIDQIIQNDPAAFGKIDILCNPIQSQIFEFDPRINRVIQTEKLFSIGPQITEWLRGIVLDAEASQVIDFLRNRHYEAILPAIVAPGIYFRLHSHLMYPQVLKLTKNLLLRGKPSDVSMRKFIRQMVNKYFGNDVPISALSDEVVLYMDVKHIQKAVMVVDQMKEESSVDSGNASLLLVAADSGSIVTRPPTYLLAAALSVALRESSNLLVGILPGYTDTTAVKKLELALLPEFADRVFMLPVESNFTLLETAALIDQADIFVTGDTGVMHLAAATKRVTQNESNPLTPGNSVKIIAIFGGTNPDVWGDSERTLIVGRGRKEQRSFGPGFVKEMYNPKGKDLFDHISSQELARAINSQISMIALSRRS
jgi:Glycosyltransferase family 9 (heptosyltransferase)